MPVKPMCQKITKAFLLIFFGVLNLSLHAQLTKSTIKQLNINSSSKDSVNESTLSGCINNWLYLNGTKSSVTIGDLDITGNEVTIEALFNRTIPYTTPNEIYAGDIVSKHLDPKDVNYLLRPNTAEITTTDGYFRTPDICDIDLNKTYHVALVYNGKKLKFYRNGFLMSETPCTGNMITNDWPTTFGTTAYPPNNLPVDFTGFINEVRIWNKARSQNQIKQYANSSLPNPTTQNGLLAYYVFDDLKNKQGNSQWDGQLNNFATINKNNPECVSFILDSCGTIIQPDTTVTAEFTIPDTVCINTPITINNTTTGGNSFFWNFCTADIKQIPEGTNLGNIDGLLSTPVFMDYVLVNNNYYGFLINHNPGKLIRLDFGNSLLNIPTTVDLGNFGGIIPVTTGAEGIQVVQNEGNWYAIIVGGWQQSGSTPRILKIAFGTDITNNSPIARDWGNLGDMSQPIDLHVFKDNDIWYGFTTNAENNTITRFNFSNSFENTPTAQNLGNLGDLQYPTGIYAINNQGNWYLFITNDNGTITRLDFGASLLNSPVANNLGILNGSLKSPRDITIMQFCDQIIGFAVNGNSAYNDIVQLDFHNNLSSAPTLTSLGNIGNLSFPHSISKLFRVGADLYSFITNASNNTITRLKFPGCTNASIANSTDSLPPQVQYSSPGTYNINLMVNEGLPTQTSICKSIVVIGPPAKAAIIDTAFCVGDSIQITANAAASHVWNTGSTASNIIIKTPGLYWVDNSNYGCTSRDSIQVNSIASPTVNLGNDTTLCETDSILLNAENAGADFNWQDGNNNQFYNAAAGKTYTVLVTNSNGCVAKDTIQINAFPAINLTINNDTTICAGSSIQLHATGNNINIYNWESSQTLSANNISNPVSFPLDTSFYTIKVTDIHGCTDTDTFFVNLAPLPTLTTIGDTAICFGTTISLLANGTGNTYQWSPSTGLSNPNIANPLASPIANTKYIVTTLNNAKCSATDTVNININPLPTIQVSNDTTTCNGNSVTLNALAPQANSFSWLPAGSLNNAQIANPVASPLQTTLYHLTVTGINGCNNTDSVLISVLPKPVFAVNPANANLCIGDSVLLSASGGDIYNWFPTASALTPGSAQTMVFPSQPTLYKVIITNTTCNVTDSVFTNITTSPKPVYTITKSNDVDCIVGQSRLNATGGALYNWSPAATLSNSTIANPVATPSQTTTYYLQLTGANGCVITDSIQVKVIIGNVQNGYLLPTAFTPNGDGLNDCFGVKSWGNLSRLEMNIYNRWGQLLFHSTNASNCWDGTYKGVPQPAGTFVYQIKATSICGDIYRKGSIILIK
ncbi:T9SS type B sorting domain-containing protein [Panacibacter sp. KCS-6]|uniref:T9SS type B sorting domain-containing protein n=1 Tax=Limnovirga soli TaxID=2656915 RepID=A0A8J8FA58_9BACT|nr:T9SS type B sorting domain-containing protein [Limnovirga soli]